MPHPQDPARPQCKSGICVRKLQIFIEIDIVAIVVAEDQRHLVSANKWLNAIFSGSHWMSCNCSYGLGDGGICMSNDNEYALRVQCHYPKYPR